MSDSADRIEPWPVVHTAGDLDRSLREWLHTNGTGAYAMSTLALMHTRREHGMLVVTLEPPLGRYVVLSHAETQVTIGARTHRLSTHQFPDVAPTPGYRLLHSYAQDPLPRWRFKLGKHFFDRTICLARNKNVLVIRYEWHGKAPVLLNVRPLLPVRRACELTHEHGAMVQRVTLRSGEVEIQPVPHVPPVVFGHRGMFMGSPDWWRRFEYTHDRAQFRECEEDLWTPGTFELRVRPGEPCYLVTALGELPEESPSELMAEAREHLLSLDPGPAHAPVVRQLSVAADSFLARSESGTYVIAGYPALEVPARDHLISLPGLTLCRGRTQDAAALLCTAASELHAGLLPNFLRTSSAALHPCPDATLWLFEATKQFVAHAGVDHPAVRATLLPALVRAFVRMSRPRGQWAWCTREGLLVTDHPDHPATWMDAVYEGRAVTPRRGVAVEHQALWCSAGALLAQLADAYEMGALADTARQVADLAAEAFRGRFWCNETEYPFDCISPEGDTAEAWADPAIRPNALVAVAVAPALFEPWQARSILTRARDELVTPRGLRSLSPRDPGYQGVYSGTPEELETQYHQGTVWSFLLGSYARAAAAQHSDDSALLRELSELLTSLVADSPSLGHVAQLSDGEPPYRTRGAPAQAWSVTELLRGLTWELGVT